MNTPLSLLAPSLIEVVNGKRPGSIPGGRESSIGNPFDMQRDERLRDPVCDAFDEYFDAVVENHEAPVIAAERVAKERGLLLAYAWKRPSREAFMGVLSVLEARQKQGLKTQIQCFCSPSRCHLNKVKSWADQKRAVRLEANAVQSEPRVYVPSLKPAQPQSQRTPITTPQPSETAISQTIQVVGQLPPPMLATLAARLQTIKPLLEADVSNYAKGRLNTWIGVRWDLQHKQFIPAGFYDDQLWQFGQQLFPDCQMMLLTYSGDAVDGSGTGIRLHRDDSYAKFEARTVSLETQHTSSPWFLRQSYPAMGFTKAQDEAAGVHEFNLRSGALISFNCKNQHGVLPGSGRWSLNLWQVSDKHREAYEQFVQTYGVSGGAAPHQPVGKDLLLPQPVIVTQERRTKLKAPPVVRVMSLDEFKQRAQMPQTSNIATASTQATAPPAIAVPKSAVMLSGKPYNPIQHLAPLNEAVAGHMPKDIAMATVATQFVGRTTAPDHTPSSTRNYEREWAKLGLANTGVYTDQDIVMISGSGPWRGITHSQIDSVFESHYKPLLEAIVTARAQVVVGTADGTDNLVLVWLRERGYSLEGKMGYKGYMHCRPQRQREQEQTIDPPAPTPTPSAKALPTPTGAPTATEPQATEGRAAISRPPAPDRIDQLTADQVFVFGSNTEGRHGAGAAKHAMQFGAEYGNPQGRQGQSYAIVTKDLTKPRKEQLRSVSLEAIEAQLLTFLEHANAHPETEFLVTKFGCALAGYAEQEIGNLWVGKAIPENVRLPQAFLEVLQAALPVVELEIGMIQAAEAICRGQRRSNQTMPTHIISIGSKTEAPPEGLDQFPGRVLRLEFNELDLPAQGLKTATEEQLEAALAFGREAQQAGGRLFVHCSAGVRRSPTIGLAILADQMGDSAQALATLTRLSPNALLIDETVALIDTVLGTQLQSQLDLTAGTDSTPEVTMNTPRTDIKVISGGQTGADLGGLKAGKALHLTTGGMAPHGWLVERCNRFPLGRYPGLADYGLVEGPQGNSVGHTYILRTEQNVVESDGTIVFGSAHPKIDKGSARTIELAQKHHKPYLHIERHVIFDGTTNNVATAVRQWLIAHNIQTVNIAGNRESKCPGLENQVALVMTAALRAPLRAIALKQHTPQEPSMIPANKPIIIGSDGACSGNPGPGGYGAIVVYPDGEEYEAQGSEAQTTNNRMELAGVIAGLKEVLSQEEAAIKFAAHPIQIVTDSQYVVQCANGTWGQKANRDLWIEYNTLAQQLETKGRAIAFEWVRGHDGHPLNERCDKLAVQARDEAKSLVEAAPTAVASSSAPQAVAVAPENKQAAFSDPLPYPHYLSLVNGQLEQQATWENCKAVTHGVSGVKYKKVKSTQERSDALKQWGVVEPPKQANETPSQTNANNEQALNLDSFQPTAIIVQASTAVQHVIYTDAESYRPEQLTDVQATTESIVRKAAQQAREKGYEAVKFTLVSLDSSTANAASLRPLEASAQIAKRQELASMAITNPLRAITIHSASSVLEVLPTLVDQPDSRLVIVGMAKAPGIKQVTAQAETLGIKVVHYDPETRAFGNQTRPTAAATKATRQQLSTANER